MLHKYLKQRGNSYHFRWRIPADLQPVFNMTELTRSLHTLDRLEASFKAGRFVEAVAGIKRVRWAYFAQEIDTDVYVSELEKYWGSVRSMARSEKTIKTGLITVGDMVFDFDGDIDKELSAVAKAKEAGLLPEVSKSEPPKALSGMLLSELFHKFIEYKIDPVVARQQDRNPLSDRMQKQYRSDIKVLLELMGDVDVITVTKTQLQQSILAFTGLPKRNKKPYNRLPIVEILEMDVPDEDLVGKKVADEVRKMVQGIFRFASDMSIIDLSPARDLNLKLTSKRTFAPYTKQEIRSILMASAKETVTWRRWIPLLAAYTGARRGELVQLWKQDIKFDTDSGRYYLMITEEAGSTKNDNANRQVPIHQVLLDAGFIDFVGESRDKLFDGLNPQSVTTWFTSFRKGLGIERFDDYGNRKVFHSFRHTFITLSRAKNHTEHVQQVVGHEKISAGVTDRYTHIMSLGEVLGVVDKVSYR